MRRSILALLLGLGLTVVLLAAGCNLSGWVHHVTKPTPDGYRVSFEYSDVLAPQDPSGGQTPQLLALFGEASRGYKTLPAYVMVVSKPLGGQTLDTFLKTHDRKVETWTKMTVSGFPAVRSTSKLMGGTETTIYCLPPKAQNVIMFRVYDGARQVPEVVRNCGKTVASLKVEKG